MQDFELRRRIEQLNVLLDRATKRMEDLFGRSSHCVLGNQWEHQRWERIKLNEVALENQDREGTELLPSWPRLTEDLYSALHRTHSVLFDEDYISPKYRGNRSLLAEVINSDEYERIHDITMGDSNMVVVAALKIQEGWIDELKRQKEEANQRRQRLEQERKDRKDGKSAGGGDSEAQGGAGIQPSDASASGSAGSDTEPGTNPARGQGQPLGASGTPGDNSHQEEGDPEEAGEGSDTGGPGSPQIAEYEPTPEPNNPVEQYEAAQALEGAYMSLREAQRLASSSEVGDAIAEAEAALGACESLTERVEDQQAYNELVQARDQQSDALRKAMRLAVQEAREQTETLQAWGIEKGMLKSMNPKEAMELSKLMRDSEELKKIAQLIGNNRIALQKRKVKEQQAAGPTVRIGIDQGRNLNKLVSSQKLLMKTSPSMFRWKYLNNELRQYKTRMDMWQDHGTGVIWVDSSGSMYSGWPFTYSQTAKATAISIMEYLHDAGRDCVLGLFDHGVREVIEVRKEATPVEMLRLKIQLASHNYGGGTDFFEPLMAGFAKIREDKYMESADQVLITDGQCYLSSEQVEEIKKAQDATKANVQTVLMPGGRASQMEQFGPVMTVSTALQDAGLLAVSIVEKMEDGYRK